LRSKIDPDVYKVWIEPLRWSDGENGTLVVDCPNDFHRQWVRQHFGAQISKILEEIGSPMNLDLHVDSQVEQTKEAERWPEQLELPRINASLPQLNMGYIFDNFVCGQSNEYAYGAARALASGKRFFSQTLYLVSGTGLGKSHLTQAVGHQIISQQPGRRVSYLTAEEFANQMVQSLRAKNIEAFKERYRRICDILLLEEVQFLGGKTKTQDELIYTLDELCNAGKRVLFTGNVTPDRIAGLKPGLKSRLGGGVTVAIEPPDHRTRVAILQRQCQQEKVTIEGEVLEYLAQEVTDDVRRLKSALVSMMAKGSLTNRPIDLNLAAEVLGQMSLRLKRLNPASIRREVARTYGMTEDKLSGKSRAKAVTRPRNLAMFLCRRHTDASYAQIGRVFNRDHATVIYGVNSIERSLKSEPRLAQELSFLEQRLGVS
jgi:chromosomal replication initiator protein